jgi:hypothetical protein
MIRYWDSESFRRAEMTGRLFAAMAIVMAAAVAAGGPAAAQPAGGLDLSLPSAAGPPVSVPFTKPGASRPSPSLQSNSENCLPGLPCGTQLYGAARRRSTLQLQVPAWRW